MSKGNFLRFISDFNVAPGWCTEAEATAVFAATNVSEAYAASLHPRCDC